MRGGRIANGSQHRYNKGLNMMTMNRSVLKKYIRDPHIWIPLAIGVVALVIGGIDAYVHFFTIRDKIVFHLNVNREIDMVGSRKELFFALSGFLCLGIINGILSYALYVRERVLSYVVAYADAFIMIIGLFFIFFVVGLN